MSIVCLIERKKKNTVIFYEFVQDKQVYGSTKWTLECYVSKWQENKEIIFIHELTAKLMVIFTFQ